MLLTLLGLVALFLVAKRLVLHYSGKPILSNCVATALIITFAAGFVTHQLLFGGPEPTPQAAAPVAVATTPTPSPTVSTSCLRVLTGDRLGRLVPLLNGRVFGVIDSLTAAEGGLSPGRFIAGTTIVVHGWAGDPVTRAPARGLLMIVDGSRQVDATCGYGGERPDVAQSLNRPAMLRTNLAAPLETGGLAKGKHRLELAAVSADGRHYEIVTAAPTLFILR